MMLALLSPLLVAAADPNARWFTNLVDHFNPQDSRTYQQKYYVNAGARAWAAGGGTSWEV